MTKHSFNYYGYSKDSYIECASLIRSTNRKHITIVHSWFLIVNIFYFLFALFNFFGVTQERALFYMTYIAINIVFGTWQLAFRKTAEKHRYVSVFMSILILLSYGIFCSIAQPYMPATMFLILLILTSLSYIGQMYIMIFIAIMSSGVFILTSYTYKTFSIAYHDSYNAVIAVTLAITLHYTFQRARIAQFILYQRDLQTKNELDIKSSFDSLTMLLNRGRFFSVVEKILPKCAEEFMALCLIDLDGFKEINDTLGHQMGDKVIQIVGRTIIKVMDLNEEGKVVSDWDLNRKMTVAGRLGGDEFILLIRDITTKEEAFAKVEGIMTELRNVKFDGLNGIRGSVGITEIKKEDKDIDDAYKRADDALYKSKRAGKNQINFG